MSLAGLYYATAKMGYLLEFAGPVAAILWLPVGVGIAFLYLGGLRYWPGVLIGDLFANNYMALPVGAALGQTCGNMLEVLLATVLLRRLVRRGSPLDSVGGVGWLVVAIAAGTALSATVGALSLLLGDVITWHAAPKVWRTWWLGDSSGALIVVPLALAWYRPLVRRWKRRRGLEAVVMLGTVIALGEYATRSHRPLTYLVFPALIWAALRFGQRGATLAVAVTAFFTVWNTIHYLGPFHFQSVTRSVLSAQLFIAVAALTTLSLAAVVSEREQFARRLGASRLRLVAAADNARRRLEQDLHDGAQLRLTWLAVQLRDAAELSRLNPERAAVVIGEAESELELAIDELRELAHGIHPAVLVDLGLAEAVKSLVLHSDIPVTLVELPSSRVDETAETIAYYIVAEAIANAQKYSRASSIQVRIVAGVDRLRIEVLDDGVGDAAERPGSG
ncbi:MAG: hypothetical protein AUH17_05540, partial [Actinobacteria bacterium 13_2_20CM_68_14]